MVKLQIAKAESERADAPRPASADHIKAVALRLFAERGVDGVTVREIAAAAGQKNHGAVGYHFGSKEALVREIIVDGAVALDALRNTALDAIETGGGPVHVRDVVSVLIYPVTQLQDEYYIRFIVMLSMTHRDLMMDALEARWNAAYGRCIAHLRRLMPPMPEALQNQRFVFMGAYLGAVLAARQRALADHSRSHPTWGSDHSLDHFAQSVTALLEAPVDLPADVLAVMDKNTPPPADYEGPVG